MTHAQAAAEQLLELGDETHHPAGAVVGIATPSGTEVAAAGWAELPGAGGAGVPMRPGMLLDLASVTKVAATTVIAMRLVAGGRLALETPVHEYLPGFTGGGKELVTLEQLLTHTAGLQPWWPLYLDATERGAAIERAQQLSLATAPGTAWAYSDLGLILAGEIVAQASGSGLAEAFARLVAGPLGLTARYGPVPAEQAAVSSDSDAYEYTMVATGIPYPVPRSPELFAGWRTRPARGEVNDGNAAHALGGVSGHAGLFATVDDLLRLGAALQRSEFVPRAVLDRFAIPTSVHPEQAVGFRRSTHPTAAGPLTVLSHVGFTGTWFAIGLEQPLVIAGGAMRLHGTVGSLPRGAGFARDLGTFVTAPQLQDVMLRAGLAALSDSPATTTEAP